MLAILAMLAPKGALRVAPGCSAPLLPCVALRSLDTLTAGTGTDIFALLTTAVGNDTISGFNAAKDMLNFSAVDQSGGWSAGTTAAAILAGATSVGGNTVLTLDGHDTITLQGVAVGAIIFCEYHCLS